MVAANFKLVTVIWLFVLKSFERSIILYPPPLHFTREARTENNRFNVGSGSESPIHTSSPYHNEWKNQTWTIIMLLTCLHLSTRSLRPSCFVFSISTSPYACQMIIISHHCSQEPNPYSIDSSPEDSSPIDSSHEGSPGHNDDIHSNHPSSSGGNVSRFFHFHANKDATPARSAPVVSDMINQYPEEGVP